MGGNKIQVHVPRYKYFGGEVINGVVELTVKSELKSRGIRMVFAAFEYTYWKTGSGKHKHTHTEKRIFLTHRFDFAGTPRHLRHTPEGQTDVVNPGVYHWPFSVLLPLNIPPSIELPQGAIRYHFTAYVDIPMAFDLKHVAAVNVGGELFSREIYTLPAPPLTLEDHKTFLFASGKMSMTATIPKTNLFAGEVIPIKLHVQNDSTKNVDAIKVQLVAHIKYYAHRSTESSIQRPDAWKVTIPHQIPEKQTVDFEIPFTLPHIFPSINKPYTQGVAWEVKLLFLEYKLIVRLDVPWASDAEVAFPIHVMELNPRWPMYYVPAVEVYYPPLPMQQSPPQGDGAPQQQNYGPPPSGQMFGPPPSAPPIYPEVVDYQYPVANQAVSLEFGEHKLDKEDEQLFG